MWIIYALASAFFAGLVSILAKVGLRNTDSNLTTALRTIVVVIFAWLMVFVVGSQASLLYIGTASLVFLILSGLATGGSWLCYFRALQIGDVNKVVSVDKFSTVLTILFAFLLLSEGLTLLKLAVMALMGVGTYLMVERKKTVVGITNGYRWLIYAIFSAVFASFAAILGKVGIVDVESTLGTAIRTVVVLVMAWLIVFMQKKQKAIKQINKKSWLFIGLSGLVTGISWLFFYRALQEGPVSVVVPIDKLSILVTVAFSYFVFHEKLNKKTTFGLALIIIGTLSLLFL